MHLTLGMAMHPACGSEQGPAVDDEDRADCVECLRVWIRLFRKQSDEQLSKKHDALDALTKANETILKLVKGV